MTEPAAARRAMLWLLFAVIGAQLPPTTAMAEEPGVRIVSPAAGQYFAPGDTVAIEVEVAASLHATDGGVTAAGLGSLHAKEFTGTRFKATLLIPDSYAGPVALSPSVMAGKFLIGRNVTINVRPRGAPKALRFPNRNHFLSPLDKEVQLYVNGTYEDGIERDLMSSVSGTTFLSSDPAVIAVDAEGLCRTVGRGYAVITVENGGLRDFVMIVVEDPEHPNAPRDLTNKVSMKRGPQRSEANGHRVLQTITLRNTSDLPVVGPLLLVATNMPDGVRAMNSFSVSLPDGLNLFPGQTASVQLEFLLWKDVAITYDLKLVDRDPIAH